MYIFDIDIITYQCHEEKKNSFSAKLIFTKNVKVTSSLLLHTVQFFFGMVLIFVDFMTTNLVLKEMQIDLNILNVFSKPYI